MDCYLLPSPHAFVVNRALRWQFGSMGCLAAHRPPLPWHPLLRRKGRIVRPLNTIAYWVTLAIMISPAKILVLRKRRHQKILLNSRLPSQWLWKIGPMNCFAAYFPTMLTMTKITQNTHHLLPDQGIQATRRALQRTSGASSPWSMGKESAWRIQEVRGEEG